MIISHYSLLLYIIIINIIVIKCQLEYLISGRPAHFDVYNSKLCLVKQLYVILTQTGYVGNNIHNNNNKI